MSEQNNDIRVQLATMFTEHNYNKRYERLSVVYYMIDGKIEFYQAIKDVPRFTPITDTLYWIPTKHIVQKEPQQEQQ